MFQSLWAAVLSMVRIIYQYSWGFFFPAAAKIFSIFFCRLMYRRSWEMQENSLKKLKPSIKWVILLVWPNLIYSDSGASDRGAHTVSCLWDVIGLCRNAHYSLKSHRGSILQISEGETPESGFLTSHSVRVMQNIMFTGAPHDPCYLDGELLCRFYAVVQAEIDWGIREE